MPEKSWALVGCAAFSEVCATAFPTLSGLPCITIRWNDAFLLYEAFAAHSWLPTSGTYY